MIVEDLRYIQFTKSPNLTGTDGCYLKTRLKRNSDILYYKLSSFDENFGFIGSEVFNEVLVSRLFNILGIPVASQSLRKVTVRLEGKDYTTYACVSKSFKSKEEVRLSARDFVTLNKVGSELPHQTLERCGFKYLVSCIFIADFLIIGRDRHDGNIEFLSNGESTRPAPLFDNGISFMAPIMMNLPSEIFKQSVLNFRELDDFQANNYLGYRSLKANLSFVTQPLYVNGLKREHKRSLFYGMHSALPDFYIDKLWNIICYRYSYLRKVGVLRERS